MPLAPAGASPTAGPAATQNATQRSPKPKSYAALYFMRRSQELPAGAGGTAPSPSPPLDPQLAELLTELTQEGEQQRKQEQVGGSENVDVARRMWMLPSVGECG